MHPSSQPEFRRRCSSTHLPLISAAAQKNSPAAAEVTSQNPYQTLQSNPAAKSLQPCYCCVFKSLELCNKPPLLLRKTPMPLLLLCLQPLTIKPFNPAAATSSNP
ncbi:hypothetical protein ACHQM5_008553 [Ranunculus cassubicifolius]